MRKFIVAIMILLFGCAVPNYPSVCDNAPPDSYLCQKANEMGVSLEKIDLILQAAALRALDKDGKQMALRFFDRVEQILNTDLTYLSLLNYIQSQIKLTSPELLIISMYLPYFNAPSPISDFDKGLLYAHIEHQRKILK